MDVAPTAHDVTDGRSTDKAAGEKAAGFTGSGSAEHTAVPRTATGDTSGMCGLAIK